MVKQVIMFAVMVSAIVALTLIAVPKAERAECYKWQSQATSYPQFTLTEWQQEQCDHHGISIIR